MYPLVHSSFYLSISLTNRISARFPWQVEVNRSKTKQFCDTSSQNANSPVQRQIPQDFLKNPMATSKLEQFCEISSLFEVDNIKNKSILRDFPQKIKVDCRVTASYHCILRFSTSSKVLRPPQKSEARSYEPHACHLAPAMKNDTRTPKIGPNVVCFSHFDFNICFATTACVFSTSQLAKMPRRVFLAFWLRNVLRATPACTPQRPKVPRTRSVFTTFSFKSASRHNGAQFLTFHPTRWLRTRRFSEPTCRPRSHKQWKNTFFRDFPTFSRAWIFFCLRLSLFWSSFFSSPLWLFPSLLLHLSILSEVWLLNFLR